MKLKAPFDCTASRPIPGQLDSLCGHLGSFIMKEIPLTQGKVALVDDEDYDFLNQWKWCAAKSGNTFYAIRNSHKTNRNSGTIRMHKIIMNPPNNMQVDHINHNGLDNRRCNLRIVTNQENHQNRIHINKTGLLGVAMTGKYYWSRIRINGKYKYLGYHKTAQDAHEAYMNEYNKIKNENNTK